MNLKTATVFLALTSFCLLESRADEEANTFENMARLSEMCAQVAPDQKMDFLQETGLTEDVFNRLVCSRNNWKTEGKHELPNSNSTITLPSRYALLIGEDAQSIFENGEENEDLEAYVCDMNNMNNQIHFENFKCGYISIDDWDKIDPKKLLSQIKQSNERLNAERRKNGTSELDVIGWVKEPTLDKDTNTVYWAFEMTEESERIVNSVALRLGREGYERVTWVGPSSLYVPKGGHLDVMLAAHSFNPGFRYEDYTIGDKVAEYGIAALVAVSAGGKMIAGAGIMFVFKKLIGFLLAGAGALLYKFRVIFRRKKCTVSENI